jgi:hypothetical protein
MYNRALDDLQRSLEADSQILDRENITVWLMRFSSGLPLKLHHPVIGNISYSGIQFAGSVLPVYDRYVSQVIEDLIEKNLSTFETALQNVEPEQLMSIGSQGASLLVSTRQKLFGRAGFTKDRLLKRSEDNSPSRISSAGVTPVKIQQRIDHAIMEIVKRVPPPEKKPVWGWLETFAKTNPTLSNIISFAAGALVTAAVDLILKKIA